MRTESEGMPYQISVHDAPKFQKQTKNEERMEDLMGRFAIPNSTKTLAHLPLHRTKSPETTPISILDPMSA